MDPLDQYAEEMKKGYFAMALLAIKNHETKAQIKGNRKELVWRIYIMMMATMPRELLEVIACGNLALEKDKNGAVADAIKYWEDRWGLQPGIYMLELVNEQTNEAPTPNQMMKILEIAKRYVDCTNDQEALQIDLHKHPKTKMSDIRAGDRQYLKNKALHSAQFYRFKTNVEANFSTLTAAEMDEPMKQPLREIGYGGDVRTRMRDHAAHRSSNFLMNLTEAVCAVFYNRKGIKAKFEMKSNVIYLMTEPNQCMFSEEMFDAIAQSNVDGGRGFCHSDAGTTASKGAINPRYKWPVIQHDVLVNSHFIKNMAEEMGRLQKLRENDNELRWVMDAIAYVDTLNISNTIGKTVPDQRQYIGSRLAELWRIESTTEILNEVDKTFQKLNLKEAEDEASPSEASPSASNAENEEVGDEDADIED